MTMHTEDIERRVTRLSELIVCAATWGYTAFLHEDPQSLNAVATGIRRVLPDCRTYIQGSQMVIDWTPPEKPLKLAALRKTN